MVELAVPFTRDELLTAWMDAVRGAVDYYPRAAGMGVNFPRYPQIAFHPDLGGDDGDAYDHGRTSAKASVSSLIASLTSSK